MFFGDGPAAMDLSVGLDDRDVDDDALAIDDLTGGDADQADDGAAVLGERARVDVRIVVGDGSRRYCSSSHHSRRGTAGGGGICGCCIE